MDERIKTITKNCIKNKSFFLLFGTEEYTQDILKRPYSEIEHIVSDRILKRLDIASAWNKDLEKKKKELFTE